MADGRGERDKRRSNSPTSGIVHAPFSVNDGYFSAVVDSATAEQEEPAAHSHAGAHGTHRVGHTGPGEACDIPPALRAAHEGWERDLPALKAQWLKALNAWRADIMTPTPTGGTAVTPSGSSGAGAHVHTAQGMVTMPVGWRQLARRGIPPSLRGVVWYRGIGNALQITPTLFNACLERAEELERVAKAGGDGGAEVADEEGLLTRRDSVTSTRLVPLLTTTERRGSWASDATTEVGTRTPSPVAAPPSPVGGRDGAPCLPPTANSWDNSDVNAAGAATTAPGAHSASGDRKRLMPQRSRRSKFATMILDDLASPAAIAPASPTTSDTASTAHHATRPVPSVTDTHRPAAVGRRKDSDDDDSDVGDGMGAIGGDAGVWEGGHAVVESPSSSRSGGGPAAAPITWQAHERSVMEGLPRLVATPLDSAHPASTIGRVLYAGWLHVQERSLFGGHRWQKRWCLLLPRTMAMYTGDPRKKRVPLDAPASKCGRTGGVLLDSTVIFVDDADSPTPQFEVYYPSSQVAVAMRATSLQSLRLWMTVLRCTSSVLDASALSHVLLTMPGADAMLISVYNGGTVQLRGDHRPPPSAHTAVGGSSSTLVGAGPSGPSSPIWEEEETDSDDDAFTGVRGRRTATTTSTTWARPSLPPPPSAALLNLNAMADVEEPDSIVVGVGGGGGGTGAGGLAGDVDDGDEDRAARARLRASMAKSTAPTNLPPRDRSPSPTHAPTPSGGHDAAGLHAPMAVPTSPPASRSRVASPSASNISKADLSSFLSSGTRPGGAGGGAGAGTPTTSNLILPGTLMAMGSPAGTTAPLSRPAWRLFYGYESTVTSVWVDLSRTFPDLAFFAEGSEMRNQLHRVLSAYALSRPDHGYVQGMSHIAAVLLLTVGQAVDDSDGVGEGIAMGRDGARTPPVTPLAATASATPANKPSPTPATATSRTYSWSAGAGSWSGAGDAPVEVYIPKSRRKDAAVTGGTPTPAAIAPRWGSFSFSFLSGGGTSGATPTAAATAVEEVDPATIVRFHRPKMSVEVATFIAFANVLTRVPLRWMAGREVDKIDAWCDLYDSLLTRMSPSLHATLKSRGIRAQMYVVGWVLTLFSRPLGLECSARLWDVCLLGEADASMRLAVALACHLQPAILAADTLESTAMVLVQVPLAYRDEFSILAAADGVHLNRAESQRLARLMWE